MADWRLVFMVVHGMGPQQAKVHITFAEQVALAARAELQRQLGDSPAAEARIAGLLEHLLLVTPEWSELFDIQAGNWLISHFSQYLDPQALEQLLLDPRQWCELRQLLRQHPDPVRRQAAVREWLVTHLNTPADLPLKDKLSLAYGNAAVADSWRRVSQAWSGICRGVLPWLLHLVPQLLLILLAVSTVAVIVAVSLGHWLHAAITTAVPLALTAWLVLLLFSVVWAAWVLRGRLGLLAKAETYLALGRRLPWGALYAFGRRFEAHNLSDLFLYQSSAPREEIFLNVLDTIEQVLQQQAVGLAEELFVLPAGHSLGSVIVYDLLLGAVSTSKPGGTSKAELELVKERILQQALSNRSWRTDLIEDGVGTAAVDELEKKLSRKSTVRRARLESGEPQPGRDRAGFLAQITRLQRRIKPLGLITFGSPIALFLFRNPDLLVRTGLYQSVCPPSFGGQLHDAALKLDWSWLNFWQPADFVSHRLEPFFNETTLPRAVVEDINIAKYQVQAPADGVEAHLAYWTSREVIQASGARVADCLLALGRCHAGAATGTHTTGDSTHGCN